MTDLYKRARDRSAQGPGFSLGGPEGRWVIMKLSVKSWTHREYHAHILRSSWETLFISTVKYYTIIAYLLSMNYFRYQSWCLFYSVRSIAFIYFRDVGRGELWELRLPPFGNFIKSIRTTDSFGCLLVSYKLSDKLLIENYYRFLVYWYE